MLALALLLTGCNVTLPLLAQSSTFPAQLMIPAWAIGVVLVIYYCVATWDRLRQKPPARDLFVEVKDFEKFEARTRIEMSSLRERSEQMSTDNRDLIQQKCNELERVISDKITDNKTSHTEQFGFLRGEIHGVRGTMQTVCNDVARMAGILEASVGKAKRT